MPLKNSAINTQDLSGKWEKRWHPLRREWIVYAAHRNSRPWRGEELKREMVAREYDPSCYLCPGNPRIHSSVNPDYNSVYVFDNDHPVVGRDAPCIEEASQSKHDGLYVRTKATGRARVICYDPKHNLSLAEMPLNRVVEVFKVWRAEMLAFAEMEDIHSALIFENKGKAVGVSNPHPHGQIYATDFPFKLVEMQREAVSDYQKLKGRNLFDDILSAEMADGCRIIAENQYAIAFIPFFARYAYEAMIFPKNRHASLVSLNERELKGMADVFHQLIKRYDKNFKIKFPYVMSFFQAPIDGGNYEPYQMHILIQPPLRQVGLLKYLAGPEIGAGNFMADTLPEEKAEELLRVEL